MIEEEYKLLKKLGELLLKPERMNKFKERKIEKESEYKILFCDIGRGSFDL